MVGWDSKNEQTEESQFSYSSDGTFVSALRSKIERASYVGEFPVQIRAKNINQNDESGFDFLGHGGRITA